MELNETAVTIAAFIGTGLAAYIGYFRKTKEEPKQIEIAGALVDAAAVRDLTSALREHSKLIEEAHDDAEKGRQLGYRLNETIGRMADETEELRHAIERASDRIRR